MGFDTKNHEPVVAPGGLEAARTTEGEVEIQNWKVTRSFKTKADIKKRTLTVAGDDSDEAAYTRLVEQARVRFQAPLDRTEKWKIPPEVSEMTGRVRARAIVDKMDPEMEKPRAFSRGTLSIDPELIDFTLGRMHPEEWPQLYAACDHPEDRETVLCKVASKFYEASEKAEERGAPAHVLAVRDSALLAYREIDILKRLEQAVRENDPSDVRGMRLPARKPANWFDHYSGRVKGRGTAASEVSASAQILSCRKEAEESREMVKREGRFERSTESAAADAAERAKARSSMMASAEERDAAEKAREAAAGIGPAMDRSKRRGTISAPLKWAPEKMIYNTRPAMMIARKHRRADLGPRILRPMKIETDPEARAFGRRLPATGAVIVVDCSGSMGIRDDQLREAMIAAPSSTVFGYSGTGYSRPNACLLAEGNRIRDPAREFNFDGSNSCDLSAILWAIDNRRGRPVIWVSDFGVSGINSKDPSCGDQFDHDHTELVKLVVKANSDILGRCHSVKDMLDLVEKWRTGAFIFPRDHVVGVDTRPVGSFA